MTEPIDLESRCERLRSLDVPGGPLVLSKEMLAAAARIATRVDVPVTVDAAAGDGWSPPIS